jgi:predicted DNA-binding transcriptional regulator AlpA
MTTCHSETDLLTVEEFADKLKVSRSTVFGWLKSGLLQEGKHYFRIGRIIRFVWDAGLFLGRKRPKGEGSKRQVRPTGALTHSTPSQPGINLDYGAPS